MTIHPSGPLPGQAAQTVGRAIQGLAAARLGRAFIPLALLFLVGVGQMLSGAGGLLLAAGAPLSAGAMLAYALRVVQRAFARPRRPWMALAGAAGVVPPAFGVWVFGWLGLRALATGEGVTAVVTGLVLTVLGGWVLRSWLKILELHALAETMALGFPPDSPQGR